MCQHHDNDDNSVNRRSFLAAGVAGAALAVGAASTASADHTAHGLYGPPAEGALPPADMTLTPGRVALVVTDPQVDFLSPNGVTWGVVGKSVTEHNTVANIGRLFRAAKQAGMTVAISPHYYYPTDHGWKFAGPLEKLMHKIGMFDRPSAYTMKDFENSGADFMPEYKEYIHDGKTIIASPHKVYGPQNNDLVLQLRKNHVDQVILAGMSANLCTEAHMRDLLEQGFEVAVVSDATAAARLPEGDGYLAAMINFRFMANGLWSTDEAVNKMTA